VLEKAHISIPMSAYSSASLQTIWSQFQWMSVINLHSLLLS